MKRQQIPQKLAYEKFYLDEKKLRTRYCRRKFIKNLLPEKFTSCKPNTGDLNRDWIKICLLVNYSKVS